MISVISVSDIRGTFSRAVPLSAITAPLACLNLCCGSSGGGLLLDVPRVNLEHYGRRAFACAGPTLWNSLPLELRAIQNTRQFGKLLKTFMFLN